MVPVPFMQRPRNASANPARLATAPAPPSAAHTRLRSLAHSPDLLTLAGRAGHLTPARGLLTTRAPLAPRLPYKRFQRKETCTQLFAYPPAPLVFFPIVLLNSCLGTPALAFASRLLWPVHRHSPLVARTWWSRALFPEVWSVHLCILERKGAFYESLRYAGL
jgi:hypothetical protein